MKNILIFTEEREIDDPIIALLESRYHVIECNNIENAVSCLAWTSVHLAVVEDNVSWSSARKLFNSMQNLELKIPVIVSVSNRTVDNVIKYLKYGATELIFKPYDANYFLEITENLLLKSPSSEPTEQISRIPLHFRMNIMNMSPEYIRRMNAKKFLQIVSSELKDKVMNSEISFDEAMRIYENKVRQTITL